MKGKIKIYIARLIFSFALLVTLMLFIENLLVKEKNDKYDQALSEHTKAIHINPNMAEVYFNKGNIYSKKGEYDKAIINLTKALQIDPEHAKAYYSRGILYAKKGDFCKFIADHTKAVQINPEYIKVLPNWEDNWENETDVTISYLTKAIEINSDNPTAYLLRGHGYYEKKKYDMALSDLIKATKIDKNYAEAYYNIACIYSIKKDGNLALRYLNKAINCGFNDYELIKEDPDLDNIRAIEGFNELIPATKIKSKTNILKLFNFFVKALLIRPIIWAFFLWLAMKIIKIEGSFFEIFIASLIAGLALLIPFVGFFLSYIVLLILISKWTSADIWPEGAIMVLIAWGMGYFTTIGLLIMSKQ